VLLVPPAAALPEVAVTDGKPDPAAIDIAAWGAQRLHLPIAVAGRGEAAEAVAKALTERGVDATSGGSGSARAAQCPVSILAACAKA